MKLNAAIERRYLHDSHPGDSVLKGSAGDPNELSNAAIEYDDGY